ncbi:MAG: hypothetical protein U9P12_02670, partial [Verrucomicrobiota bacterium]|nr:hypothetical protein [Verrucomicrobiota bacterium]
MKLTKVLITALCSVLAVAGWSDVKLNPIFTDHMVLQRNHATPVYGTADPGEKVTVEFAGQVKTAITDSSKHWKVVLDPMPASSEPRKLVVRSSIGPKRSADNFPKGNSDEGAVHQQSEIVDVLVGDVWLCAGQSNMATEIRLYPTLREEKADALNNPMVRLFKFQRA